MNRISSQMNNMDTQYYLRKQEVRQNTLKQGEKERRDEKKNGREKRLKQKEKKKK